MDRSAKGRFKNDKIVFDDTDQQSEKSDKADSKSDDEDSFMAEVESDELVSSIDSETERKNQEAHRAKVKTGNVKKYL